MSISMNDTMSASFKSNNEIPGYSRFVVLISAVAAMAVIGPCESPGAQSRCLMDSKERLA